MATEKTFTVAGTSVLNGVMTFRVANGEAKKRGWVLKHNGHTDINLLDLAKAMTKTDAVAFLIASNHPGADVAVVPGGSKGKTPEQIAAEEEARKAAEEAAKKEARNAARREARKLAKAAKAAESDADFVASAADVATEASEDADIIAE